MVNRSTLKNLLLCIGFIGNLIAQTYAQSFSGVVLDSKSKQPLAYVNIGIPSEGLGIMSDENGKFTLPLDKEFESDTLRFSLIGYKNLSIPVINYFSKYSSPNSEILLDVNIYDLSEVTVKPKNIVNDMLGNTITNIGTKDCKAIVGLLDSIMQKDQEDDIRKHKHKNSRVFAEKHIEVGTIFEIKKRETYIDKVQIQFCETNFDSIRLRLNIYSNLSQKIATGIAKFYMNYTNILKTPIYFTVRKKDSLVEIDLRQYNIRVEDNFIVTFETLKSDDNKKIKIPCNASFSGEPAIFHLSNGTPYIQLPILKLGFNVSISYEKKGNWFTNLFNW